MKKLSYFVMLVAVITFFTSCAKTEMAETNLEGQVHTKGSATVSVFNQEKVSKLMRNPLDYIGIAHNVALRALIDNVPSIENETLCYNIVNENMGKFNGNILKLSFNDFDKLIQFLKGMDYKITLDNVKNRNLFSEKQITLMARTEQNLNSNVAISIKKEKLIEQEEAVMKSTSFSEKEKNELRAFLATARRSIEFWSENSEMTNIGGIVLADALGAGLGALILPGIWPVAVIALGVSSSYVAWFESTK